MIRLIKIGKPKKKKCKACNSKMEYEETDVLYDHKAERICGIGLYYIVCPNYGKYIYIRK